MQTIRVNLYEHFGLKPSGAGGSLRVWKMETSPEVSPGRLRPAMLILPGGGYVRTSAREAEQVALRFAAAGYVPFVLDYSCAPSIFPTALREAAMAMRYIRENASAFEVNPQMVAALGFSAGGHLCGTLGTLFDCDEVLDIGSARLLRPDALVLCYPVAVSWGATHEGSFENLSGGDEKLRQRLSLDRCVRQDMPPVFLWHTRDDASVPVRNSLILAGALEEAGVDFALHIYRHGQHGLSTADEMAFPAYALPEVSRDLIGWPERAMAFLKEIGFQILDRER
ncbi:MAG: alpha/beta hydrolase [Ruminococcaceae bacterium]|nr:alpha/beta hydrolase [Oscillospiraceae bacterium]